jgi:hypothetical protein
MQNSKVNVSLRSAAVISGFALLTSVIAAPFAELYAFPRLVVPGNAIETAKKILSNQSLFVLVIFAYLLTFICDVIIAWATYILLKPVNGPLSLLTAGLRLIYTIVALVALNNLVTVYRLLTAPEFKDVFEPQQLYAQVFLYLRVFRYHWYFGIIFFAFHLLFLGFLVMKARFIPGILGIILMITGIGYLLTTLKPYLFPTINVDFASYTFYGELIFMLWLLIRGWTIKEPIENT